MSSDSWWAAHRVSAHVELRGDGLLVGAPGQHHRAHAVPAAALKEGSQQGELTRCRLEPAAHAQEVVNAANKASIFQSFNIPSTTFET
jgi:hypothetical protein